MVNNSNLSSTSHNISYVYTTYIHDAGCDYFMAWGECPFFARLRSPSARGGFDIDLYAFGGVGVQS